jgi:DNA-binding winged helix-turn-helix (wHTH) protein
MKFASAAGLIRLLLQQSDRHPIRSIGAADLQPYDPRFVRTLRNSGILTEREDLRDDGASVFQVVDDALIAVDPETGACESGGDALDIQAFDIDIGAICRAIREQSGLEGPGPSAITTRVWRLGRYVGHGRTAEICLVRRLREATAQEVVDHVRGAIDTETSVALISLARIDLPTAVARQLDAMRMTVVVAEDLMGQVPGSPFALNLDRIRLASSMPAVETRLVVDRTGRRAIFDGVELSIEPRDFDVFVLMADEAADAGGWVLRDSISATLRASTRRDGNPEQVDRCISRLRAAFRNSAGLTEMPRHALVETKPKVGYRLTLATSEIGFMA